MKPGLPYSIFPLGDTALIVQFGEIIDETVNKEVVARFNEFSQNPFKGMREAAPAYNTLAIYYDISQFWPPPAGFATVFDFVKSLVEERLQTPLKPAPSALQLVKVPVCYEEPFAPGLHKLATEKKLSPEQIIEIHTAFTYTVYMLGFLPGFAYMGAVDERIATPRLASPVPVAAGSVGIAGRQTGIYPVNSPGGWTIIGRTPSRLFNIEKDRPALLSPGDSVLFYPINKNEFGQYGH